MFDSLGSLTRFIAQRATTPRSTQGDLMDWRKTVAQLNSQLNNSYDTGVESVLDRLGLEPKRQNTDMILPALSIFSAGLVVGAALGVLFAPKRGDELRGDLRHRLSDLRSSTGERYDELRAHHLDSIE